MINDYTCQRKSSACASVHELQEDTAKYSCNVHRSRPNTRPCDRGGGAILKGPPYGLSFGILHLSQKEPRHVEQPPDRAPAAEDEFQSSEHRRACIEVVEAKEAACDRKDQRCRPVLVAYHHGIGKRLPPAFALLGGRLGHMAARGPIAHARPGFEIRKTNGHTGKGILRIKFSLEIPLFGGKWPGSRRLKDVSVLFGITPRLSYPPR